MMNAVFRAGCLDRLWRGLRLGMVAVALACTGLPTLAADPQYDWQGVERIVAVGDLHGDYDNYLRVIQEAGLVDRRGKWIGGETHFVQLGDVPDRGPDTDRIIEHLMQLEKQAEKAGGRVHALVGNHEALNMVGDLTYVDPGEFEALKTRASKKRLDDYYKRLVSYLRIQDDPPELDSEFREAWYAEHPPGWVEHRMAWSPEGKFGSWVLEHPAMIRINRIVFMHGGLGPEYLPLSIAEINAQVSEELANPAPPPGRLSDAENGPLWYRGFARQETPEEAVHVQAFLDRYEADHVVVGHTPGFGTVVPRFEARVLVVDSGISSYYGGHRASLTVEGGDLFTVQQGERVPIPETRDGLLGYYREIDAIEPEVNNLKVMIQRLENPEPVTPEAGDESGVDGAGSAEDAGADLAGVRAPGQ